jgi:hypothetical protein
MRKRKAAALLLALALLVSLTGCGREAEKKTRVTLESGPAPIPETQAPVETRTRGSFAGDWYGWWRMKNTRGDWAHMYGYYWDCLCEIRETEDGGLHLLLWDEDMARDNWLAQAELVLDYGEPQLKAGDFLDRTLADGDWEIRVSQDQNGTLLTITGKYDAVGKGGFSYEINLRPWGSRWEVPADEQPYYYSDWYLPLIEAGEGMPDALPEK